jgi:hypothetical protein
MTRFEASAMSDYLAFALILLTFVTVYSRRQKRFPVPPGPKGLPIVGNIFQFPRKKEWEVYAEWAKLYGQYSSSSFAGLLTEVIAGKIMSLHAFGSTIIIINDHETAIKLLDKRSLTYSDRPVMPMLTEAMGWKNTLGFSPYGERFKRYRKLVHQFIGTRSAAEKFAPIMEREIKPFLRRIVEEPEQVQAHIRR